MLVRETAHCSVCGNVYAAASSPRKMDMAPRKTPTASALHSRTARAGVLDLRAQGTGAQPAVSTPMPTAAKLVSRRHGQSLAKAHADQPQPSEIHVTGRINIAKSIPRSPGISRFSDVSSSHLGRLDLTPQSHRSDGSSQAHAQPLLPTAPAPAQPAAPNAAADAAQVPNTALTAHESLAQLAKKPHGSNVRPHLSLIPNIRRTTTVLAIVAVMGGYIWMQNYPKLALQSASQTSGVDASLPGYMPSSYNLASTNAKPGLVSLRFSSPSLSDELKIDQHRTSWDSISLLDNFVSKQTDDYSTIHGQGLTVYLFGQNEASWVNHGVWYSIVGANKLSRDQLLKIAYSL